VPAMKALSKYITTISAFQFSQLCRFVSLFLIGIVFVRFYATSEIGLYETVIFIAGAVSFFWLWGILQTFITLSPATMENGQDGKQRNKAYFNAFILLLLFSLLTVVFLVVFRNAISQFLNNNKELPFFKWLLLYILLSSPSNLTEYIYLDLQKSKHIIVYSIVSNTAQLLFLTIPAIIGFSMVFAIMSLVLVNGLRFIWLLIIIYKNSHFQIDISFIKKNLKLAVPIIGSSILSGSGPYIDGLIITHFYDDATFALFRYGAREFPLAIILVNALSNGILPEFSKFGLSATLEKLKKQTRILMHLLFPFTIVLIVSSQWLFKIFFSNEFLFSAQIFNLYLLLTVPRLILPNTIVLGLKKNTYVFWIAFIEIIINVIVSIAMVRVWGVLGVVFGTVISFFVERVIYLLLLRYKFNIQINNYIPAKLYFIYATFTVAIYGMVQYFHY
jgi:O-antigen/teichoic acid export membrane protein